LDKENDILKTPENINTELGVSAIVLSKLKKKYNYFIAEM
jgi:UDP-N-acetylmuramyl pentapeptide synthase